MKPASRQFTLCHEPYDEDSHAPKVLQCGHTFCLTNIGALSKPDSMYLTCPDCHMVSPAPTLLRNLPTNHALLKQQRATLKKHTDVDSKLFARLMCQHEMVIQHRDLLPEDNGGLPVKYASVLASYGGSMPYCKCLKCHSITTVSPELNHTCGACKHYVAACKEYAAEQVANRQRATESSSTADRKRASEEPLPDGKRTALVDLAELFEKRMLAFNDDTSKHFAIAQAEQHRVEEHGQENARASRAALHKLVDRCFDRVDIRLRDQAMTCRRDSENQRQDRWDMARDASMQVIACDNDDDRAVCLRRALHKIDQWEDPTVMVPPACDQLVKNTGQVCDELDLWLDLPNALKSQRQPLGAEQ